MTYSTEMFAFCVNDAQEEGDDGAPFVRNGHLYHVAAFVRQRGFFPYGVRIMDAAGTEMPQTFFMQRFTYFEHHLN